MEDELTKLKEEVTRARQLEKKALNAGAKLLKDLESKSCSDVLEWLDHFFE